MANKRALLVGINYVGTESELKGCLNDVENMKNVLIKKYGYLEENIKILNDNTEMKPTRKNILVELLNLVLSESKYLFFHYSGHGSYVTDRDGDEADGNDECLVPIDYETLGMIIDDELKGILQCVSEESKLIVILDCCHSGSGLDLAYSSYERVRKLYMLTDGKNKETRGNVIMISGCQDPQTSADAFIENKNQGALTFALLSCLNRSDVRTYEQLLREIKKILKDGKYSQIPCLSSGKKLDLTSNVNF